MLDIVDYTNFSMRNISIEKFHPNILSEWLSQPQDDVTNYFCLFNKEKIIISICSYLLRANCICINGLFGFNIEECLINIIDYIRKQSLLNIFISKIEYNKCLESFPIQKNNQEVLLKNIIQNTHIQLFPKPCHFVSLYTTSEQKAPERKKRCLNSESDKKPMKKRGRQPSNLTPTFLNITEEKEKEEKVKDEMFKADCKSVKLKTKARKTIFDH
jgi:hypothetical protein